MFLALLGYNFLRENKVDILTSANCLLIQNVPIITHLHTRRNNVRENMGRHSSTNETYEKSFDYEVPMLNELPIATAIATVTSPKVTPDTAFIEKNAPTKQSADQLSLQPTDSDKSKVPNAMSLFFVKPHEPVFVNIDQHGPTFAGLYTIESAML